MSGYDNDSIQKINVALDQMIKLTKYPLNLATSDQADREYLFNNRVDIANALRELANAIELNDVQVVPAVPPTFLGVAAASNVAGTATAPAVTLHTASSVSSSNLPSAPTKISLDQLKTLMNQIAFSFDTLITPKKKLNSNLIAKSASSMINNLTDKGDAYNILPKALDTANLTNKELIKIADVFNNNKMFKKVAAEITEQIFGRNGTADDTISKLTSGLIMSLKESQKLTKKLNQNKLSSLINHIFGSKY